MKKLLNTLYVTRPDTYLHCEGDTIVVKEQEKVLLRLPIHTISSVVCFGNVRYSSYLPTLCSEHGVHLSFLSERGKFLYRTSGGISGNVLLRLDQVNAFQTPAKATMFAKSFVIGKVLNCRNLLMRHLRDHGGSEALNGVVKKLASAVLHVKNAEDVADIDGWEGEAAKLYFSVFNELILAPQPTFVMHGRSRRPPLDPVNCLLSFLYTLLIHECEAALESVGLDPQVGFLHAVRPGRPSLACDLAEEFRAPLADRLVLTLLNLKQLSPNGFKKSELGAVEMTDDARKTVLTAWQTRKQEAILHPFLNEKVEIGLLPYIQAQLLAKAIRGELDGYAPCLWR